MSRTMFRAFGVALALASATSSLAYGQAYPGQYANTYIDPNQLYGPAPQSAFYQTTDSQQAPAFQQVQATSVPPQGFAPSMSAGLPDQVMMGFDPHTGGVFMTTDQAIQYEMKRGMTSQQARFTVATIADNNVRLCSNLDKSVKAENSHKFWRRGLGVVGLILAGVASHGLDTAQRLAYVGMEGVSLGIGELNSATFEVNNSIWREDTMKWCGVMDYHQNTMSNYITTVGGPAYGSGPSQ